MKRLKKEAGQMNWPHERGLKGGLTGYKIYGRYSSPALAKFIDSLFWVTLTFGAIYYLFIGFESFENEYAFIWWPAIFAAIFFLSKGLFWLAMIFIFGHRIHIIIRPGYIHIGKWYGYKTLSLMDAPIELGVETHPNLEKEYKELSKKPAHKRDEDQLYYKDSMRVFLRYGEKKYNIAPIYHSPEKSDALARRIGSRLNEFNMSGGC